MYIILGASSGIGLIVLKKVALNNQVIAVYNSKKPTLKENIRKNVDFIKIDFNKKNNYDYIFNKYKKKLKNIICLNLAAVTVDKMLPNISEEEIIKTFKVNALSNILIAKSIIKFMLSDKWGRFIHFTSTKAIRGDKGISIYSSSKSSLIGFSNSLAKEYGRFNITSNIISLGYFDSPLWHRLSINKKEQLLNEVPSKNIGNIKDIVSTIKYIKKTSYLNAAEIKLDGGI